MTSLSHLESAQEHDYSLALSGKKRNHGGNLTFRVSFTPEPTPVKQPKPVSEQKRRVPPPKINRKVRRPLSVEEG